MLQRHRHLGCCDVAQLMKQMQEFGVARDEADAQPGHVGALRQRLERHHIGEIRSRHFQHAAGRLACVDLRIAFVGQHHEAVTIGERLQSCKIVARGDRALRIGRRGQIDRDGAGERRRVERVEIGQKTGCRGGGQKDRLAAGGAGAGAIGRVERIGQQDRRLAARVRGQSGRRPAPPETAPRGCRSAPGFRSPDRSAAARRSGGRASRRRRRGTARCPWPSDSDRTRRCAGPAPRPRTAAAHAAARRATD